MKFFDLYSQKSLSSLSKKEGGLSERKRERNTSSYRKIKSLSLRTEVKQIGLSKKKVEGYFKRQNFPRSPLFRLQHQFGFFVGVSLFALIGLNLINAYHHGLEIKDTIAARATNYQQIFQNQEVHISQEKGLSSLASLTTLLDSFGHSSLRKASLIRAANQAVSIEVLITRTLENFHFLQEEILALYY